MVQFNIKEKLASLWAFSSNFGKRPLAKIGRKKMLDLTTKLGEINNIPVEHNISSKSSYFRLYYAKHTT